MNFFLSQIVITAAKASPSGAVQQPTTTVARVITQPTATATATTTPSAAQLAALAAQRNKAPARHRHPAPL